MNMHKGARLSPYSRALLVKRIVEHGLRVEEAAQAAGVSARTAYKWLRRFREEGVSGLVDRSSRPHACPHATSELRVVQAIERRHARQTYRTIAQALGVAPSTVGRLLQRVGLNRLASLEPAAPIRRYEHEAPGDLLHLDIKKLGRFWQPGHRVTGDRKSDSEGAGWEYIHVAIDDHSRVAFSSIERDETGASACRALLKTVRYYRGLGIRFARVLTDNGACTDRGGSPACSGALGLSTATHDPIHRVPTARPNASSRPPCANGRMPAAIKPLISARRTCCIGCIITTGIASMPAWVTSPRSAAFLRR